MPNPVRTFIAFLFGSRTAGPALVLWCLSIGCLILPCRVLAWSFSGDTAGVVSRSAERLVERLERKVDLSGKTVQVSENNFWQRGTRLNLPFSAVLGEALAAAVSGSGATVTVQEVGREPLRLVGTYAREGEDLVVTARVRLMGATAAGDIAVARDTIARDRLDARWFKPEFGRVARTLVRLLEFNYHGAGSLEVKLQLMQPGPNQPPLAMGREFDRFLRNAVAASALFRTSALGPAGAPVVMGGEYVRVNDRMRFHVRIVDRQKRELTGAHFEIDVRDIPPDLLAILTPETTGVCLTYRPSRNLPADSPAAFDALDYVAEALTAYGVTAENCAAVRPGSAGVKVRLRLDRRSTTEGFEFAAARLRLAVLDEAGKVRGVITRRSRMPFTGDVDETAAVIVQKLFADETIAEELAPLVLAR
jgi:hypothetical protein